MQATEKAGSGQHGVRCCSAPNAFRPGAGPRGGTGITALAFETASWRCLQCACGPPPNAARSTGVGWGARACAGACATEQGHSAGAGVRWGSHAPGRAAATNAGGGLWLLWLLPDQRSKNRGLLHRRPEKLNFLHMRKPIFARSTKIGRQRARTSNAPASS